MSDRREFLMLAKTFLPKKHGVGGWYISEKLDGQRAFWDGGITRGMLKAEVPWANTAKDGRLLNEQVATGLWSRYGNVIHAPDWWLNELPRIMMDGELWHGVRGHGQRQNLSKIIKPLVPDEEAWKAVKFYAFDLPCASMVFKDGRINSPNYQKVFQGLKIDTTSLEWRTLGPMNFNQVVKNLNKHLVDNKVAVAHEQTRVSFQTDVAVLSIDEQLNAITSLGGEGLILRKPESWWMPKRMATLLKVKKFEDSEGIVTGFISGRKTDKGSKLLGLMGAMILDYEGKRLELSGFTDEERRLGWTGECRAEAECSPSEWAEQHPGEEVPEWITTTHFKRGEHVTFRYRGKTLDGIPSEARFWRRLEIV